MQSPYRPDWLRRDFSRICEFFNDSDEEENKGAPLVDPSKSINFCGNLHTHPSFFFAEYAFEVNQESTGDSSEFEFSNDSDFEEV